MDRILGYALAISAAAVGFAVAGLIATEAAQMWELGDNLWSGRLVEWLQAFGVLAAVVVSLALAYRARRGEQERERRDFINQMEARIFEVGEAMHVLLAIRDHAERLGAQLQDVDPDTGVLVAPLIDIPGLAADAIAAMEEELELFPDVDRRPRHQEVVSLRSQAVRSINKFKRRLDEVKDFHASVDIARMRVVREMDRALEFGGGVIESHNRAIVAVGGR